MRVLLQAILGRIGRKTRHECAYFISQQLAEELAANPAAESVLVTVTNREFLDAFQERRFGRSSNQLIHKLNQRIRANLHSQPLLVSARSITDHGTLTSLRITAERISAPRR